MPARNLIKFYLPNSIYHIYNLGVEKRIIFNDDQDYNVFLSYIKEYLSPEPQGVTLRYRDLYGKYYEKIKLLAFCLMPNHFHLLIKQTEKDNIKKFTQSLFTRYTMYFNRKYKRIGGLFQSTYKATNVIDKEHLLYVSKYIHRNPIEIIQLKNLSDAYSSYSDYLGYTNTLWLDKTIIQDEFNKSSYIKYHNIKNYKYFVEVYKDDMPQYDLF
jgi:putative transposase